MTTYSSTMDTPAGKFTAIVDGDGAVLASGWTGDVDDLLPLIHRDLLPPIHRALLPPIHRALGPATPTAKRDLGAVTRAIRAYHAGDLTAPDAITVRQHSDGAFLTAAWKALRDVPPGQPVSYTEFAERAGNRAASRAAAQACARNAAALFVPCHRVVRADGSVGGFRWGPDVKAWLLDHES